MSWADAPRSKPKNIALHQMLGIDITREIPVELLRRILATPIGGAVSVGFNRVIPVTTSLKYRANFALNAGQDQSGRLF